MASVCWLYVRDTVSFCRKVFGRSGCGKATGGGDYDIIRAGGAVDDLHIAIPVSAGDDSDVGVIGVENEVAGLGVGHCYFRAAVMLACYAASLPYDNRTVGSVIEYPIHEAGAVEAEGAVGAGGLAAFGPYLLKLAPSGIPTKHTGFPAPKVVDLADKRKGIADYLLSLG